MLKVRKSAILMLGMLLSTQALGASPKDEFKQAASKELAEMAASGEPKSRCSLSALFADDGLVVRTVGETPLKAGDRVRSIDGASVRGKPYADLRRVLQNTPANASVELQLERAGETKSFRVNCVDAYAANLVLSNSIAAAAKGKFDECLQNLGSHQELGTAYWMLRLNCAAFSKRGRGEYDPENLSRWLLSTAEDATWQPEAQAKFLDLLRKAEPMLANAGRTDLHARIVDVTRAWPNSKSNAYEATSPNWARFRAKAESALRARLIDPSSAEITWSNGFLYGSWKPAFRGRIEGYWTCGLINARNRMGGFAGTTNFVVVMPDENTVAYADVGTSNDVDIVSAQCQKSAKLLPLAPPELTAAETIPTGTLSVADELQKLAALRDKGIITAQEFEAQKAKLLGR